MAQNDSPSLSAARHAVVMTSTPNELRAMASYVSGFAPDAFVAAMLHVNEFPASTPEDEYRPRHSAAHRAEVAK